MNGIITIATGHKMYGYMAYNLALSVKTHTNLPISVIACDNALSGLTDTELKVFDNVIEAPVPDMNWAQIKLRLPAYTPYVNTLFLDADTIVISDVDKEFIKLDKADVCIANEGYTDMQTGKRYVANFYANDYTQGIAEKLKLKGAKLYSCRSEFILFNNSKKAKDYFYTAATLYSTKYVAANPLVATIGGLVFDEVAFDLAACKLGIDNIPNEYSPTYWPALHGGIIPPLHELNKKYSVLSIGGNRLTDKWLNVYYLALQAATYKLGLNYRLIQPKNELNINRQTL